MSLTTLNKRAMELGRERAAKIDEKKRTADIDPMMTSDERAQFIASWTKDINAKYEKAMAELKDDASYMARQIAEDGARVRPTFDPSSAADLTRTEQAWRNIVLPQLEKGRTLSQALRNADRDAVLGAERFAAGYLSANQVGGDSFGDQMAGSATRDYSREVQVAVTERFADLVDPADAETLRAAARVDTELEAFHQIAAMTTEGGRDLEAALLAHYSSQPAPADDAADDAMAESA